MDTPESRLKSLELYLSRPELAIVCMRCKYALQPKGDRVSRHLWEKHHVPIEDRKGLVSLVASLDLQDPNTLPLRKDGCLPHPHLARRRGLACRGCKERTTSRDLMQRHLSKEHGCKPNRRTPLSDSIFNSVTLQSWTQNGSRESWIVENSGNSDEDEDEDALAVSLDTNSDRGPEKTQRLAALAALHEAERQRLTNEEQGPQLSGVVTDDLALVSNWMRRTGWATTFARANRRLLSSLDQTPARDGHCLELGSYGSEVLYSSIEDERSLAIAAQAADRFFEQCEDTARHTEHSIRCWLRSQIPGRPYKAPFELPGRERTRIVYRNLWKRLLFVLLRMYKLDHAARRTFLDIQLTDKQQEAIGQLWVAIQAHEHEVLQTASDLQPARDFLHATSRTHSSDDDSIRTSHQRQCRHKAIPKGISPVHPNRHPLRSMRGRGSSRSPVLTGGLQADSNHSSSTDESENESGEDCDDSHMDQTSDTDYDDEDEEGREEELLLLAAEDEERARSTSEHVEEEVHNRIHGVKNDALADAVGRISAFLCTEEFIDNRSSSTLLVYFSGLISFPYPGDTFERPNNYTPRLSALIYCARLCLLEMSIPRYAHPLIGWEARPPRGSLDMLNKVRERFMCLGCQSPMGELISLRSYGRAISRSDGPTFRVNWSEDSQQVSWDTGKETGKLTMDQFRQLGCSTRANASTSLARLMYGWMPTIRLTGLRDTLSNQKKGYSFVQEPANKLTMAYLDLSSRACLDADRGLMRGNRWDMAAVRSYLEVESQFLVDIMLVMHVLAGQGPRSTELFSLECRNGESTSRGVYIHDGSLVYITRHSKARKSTNNEFQVARYLGSQESRLLATYLIYVRPLTDMLCRVCLSHDNERRRLFVSPHLPDKPWKVQVLTNALKRLTKNVCGSSFGVQIYRQLSIAVTEKHVKQISKPFNRYDDKTMAADIEVAYSWQSGHRPIQRGTTYGIDGAFPDSLQPALLRVYRWASEEWQIFMGSTAVQAAQRVQYTFSEPHGTKRYASDVLDQRETTRPCRGNLTTALSTPSQPIAPDIEAPIQSSNLCQSLLPKSPLPAPHTQGRPLMTDAGGSHPWETVIQQRAHRAQSRRSTETARPNSQWHYNDCRAFELFAFLSKYGVIVCRECQYAVWPMEIGSHLAGSMHKMLKNDRDRIQQEVQRWKGLVWNKDTLMLPIALEEVIPELSVHDGFLCTIDQQVCNAISLRKKGMKDHWREVHEGWTASGMQRRGGRLNDLDQQAMLQRLNNAYRMVSCQRFFGSRSGSQYIAIV